MRQWIKYCATLGPVGYLPASGTVGSFVALLLLLPLRVLFFIGAVSVRTQCLILLFLTLAAVVLIQQALNMFGWVHSDPRQIVLDELIGCWWAFFGVALTLGSITTGFLLFRFFDIIKPWPVSAAERLSGAWGILLDDICAGLLTLGILKIWY